MTYYLDCSYRDIEDWLLVSDTICRSLDLQEVPDHTTLCRAFHRLDIRLLRAMQRLLLQEAIMKEAVMGVASTGFRTDQASAYYSFRNGDPKRIGSRVPVPSELPANSSLASVPVMDVIKILYCSRACAVNLDRTESEIMYFWQMQDWLAGKSNSEILFHLCEGTGRFGPQKESLVLNWLRRHA